MSVKGGTFVYRNGEIVPKHTAEPRDSGASYIISDNMADTWHPASGKIMSSKSEFRKETRAHGCVEVGNEPLRNKPIPPRPRAGPDIARAIEQLMSR
jgi:hypothetical protein